MKNLFPHGVVACIDWPNEIVYKRIRIICIPVSIVTIIFCWLSWVVGYLDLFIPAASFFISSVILFGVATYLRNRKRRYWRLTLSEWHANDRRFDVESRILRDMPAEVGELSADISCVTAAILGLGKMYVRSSGNRGLLRRSPANKFAFDLFGQEFASRGLATPRYIIDKRFLSDIKTIALTDHLLEPEFVTSHGYERGSARSRANIIFIGMGILGSLPFLIGLVWFNPTASVVLFLIALLLYVRSYFYRSRLRSQFVVGNGTLAVNNSDSVFCVNDALTLVRPFKGKLAVILVGSNDEQWSSVFQSPRDDGFVDFWRHWNHPHPRRDLLERDLSPQQLQGAPLE